MFTRAGPGIISRKQNHLTVSGGLDILEHWNFYRYKSGTGAAAGLISKIKIKTQKGIRSW
jgi:hypothetical protein